MTEAAGPALAVVIPAGPRDDVADTLASVLHYTAPPRLVVVVDDTGRDVGATLEATSPDVAVVRAPGRAAGSHGGLWVKIAAGYRFALAHLDVDVLLRLDADALVIGAGIAEIAAARFASDQRLGLLGSYRYGPDGGTRDWSPAADALRSECGLRGISRPRSRRTLRALRARAVAQGYVAGEHALGGAYLHSGAAARALCRAGWLELPELAQSRLGEDHLFALLTVAAGFAIGDFGGPDDPLAITWQGLPAPPTDLLARGKLVTHSVRSFGELGETGIRARFAAERRPVR